MKTLTSAINVQVNKQDKEEATMILNELGLSMSAAINMFLKQIIRKNGIPFEVTNSRKFSRELKKSLKEADKILKQHKSGKRQGYTDVDELFKSLNE